MAPVPRIHSRSFGQRLVPTNPPEPAVIRRHREGPAVAIRGRADPFPDPSVVGNQGANCPRRGERQGFSSFRGDRGQPTGRGGHELGKALGTSMRNRILAPGRFLVDLCCECGDGCVHAPNHAGFSDQERAVLLGLARNLGSAGKGREDSYPTGNAQSYGQHQLPVQTPHNPIPTASIAEPMIIALRIKAAPKARLWFTFTSPFTVKNRSGRAYGNAQRSSQ